MDFLKDITPRDYQQKILGSCIEKNCLVVLPTGLGKTLIALMLAIERMKKFPGEKVLLLAPTRPLAEQHLNFFTAHLSDLFGDLQLFTGSVKADQRKKIWKTADIIFSTPQCIANDLKKRLYDLSDVCLLVEDEAHRCMKNYDYTYVAQKYKETAQHPRILGLTASPGSEVSKIKEICKNLFIEEVELRTRESEDVKHNLQEREFEKVIVELPQEIEEMRRMMKQVNDIYIDELKSRHLLFDAPTKTNLIFLQKRIMNSLSKGNKNFNVMKGASSCASAIKLQHAIELLETQTLKGFHDYLADLFDQAAKMKSKGVQQLMKRPEMNLAFIRSAELLKKGMEHPKISKLAEIVELEKAKNPSAKIIVFSQFRDTALQISKTLNKISGITAGVFIGQAKKKGEGLSQKEQKRMIVDFSSGELNVLCATSIGEEGLDIPEVSVVIFYEPVASAIRTIQRAGRTARLKPGKLMIMITKATRDESFYYVSRAREKKMQTAITSIKKDMTNGIDIFSEQEAEKQESLESFKDKQTTLDKLD